MKKIPISQGVYKQKFDITLGGKPLRLRITFNKRLDRYHLDILTQEDVEIKTGIPMLVGIDMLAYSLDTRLPTGNLLLINSKGIIDGGDGELGDNLNLLYNEAA